jgi:peptide/nickel transport system substrate-binding protein
MIRSIALLAAVLPALAHAGVRPAPGGTIRIGVPAAPRAAPTAARPSHPVGSESADVLERAVSAPLLEVDARGALVPGALAEVPLAEAGGRAFRLRLRPGLADAMGRPLGAADVAARLSSLLARDAPSPHAWVALPILGADALLEGRAPLLAGVQVLSPTELLVTLAFPLPELPFLLATTPAALRGAGPFVVAARRSASDPLVLRPSEHHHRGRTFAAEIEIRPVDARGAARQLEQHALDLVLRPEAAGVRAGPALPPLTATVAVLNAARLGAGAEAVRRTFAALDRGDLARRFVRGPAEPLRTLIPPAILPGAPPAAARPAGGPAPAPVRLTVLADASGADQRALAERIQVKLFDQGLRTGVELVDRARFGERLAAGDYDVALLSVPVAGLRPALAAGQIAFAARGAAAARRAMKELAGLSGDAALAAADRLGRDLDLVPLVASGLRASLGPALQGFDPGADGAFDVGALWLLGGGAR